RQAQQSRPSGPVAPRTLTAADMTYHGGTVQVGPTRIYTIFWTPPDCPSSPCMSTNYSSLLNRWFTDTGGGLLYRVMTQYYQTSGGGQHYVVNSSSLAGTWTDTTNSYGTSDLADSAITAEVERALAANPSWTPDANSQVFVFTGKNELSHTSSISFLKDYCAYHSYYFSPSKATSVAYSNMPYAGSSVDFNDGFGVRTCNNAYQPNGDLDADSELIATSHEQFETLTDPQFEGWWGDAGDDEIGDKCAYNF